MQKMVVVYSLTLITVNQVTSYCIHDDVQENSLVTTTDQLASVHEGKARIRRRRSLDDDGEFQPIRIHTHYDKLGTELFDDEIKILKQTLKRVIQKISQTLSVLPVKGPLLLERVRGCHKTWGDEENAGRCSERSRYYTGEICMNELKIPDSHLNGLLLWNKTGTEPIEEVYKPGPGVNNTDYILYVQARSTRSCQTYQGREVLAYAVFCHQDGTGRPVSGYVNVCPRQLKSYHYNRQHLYMVLLHELFHALGFSTKLFPSFQRCTDRSENVTQCMKYGDSLFEQLQGVTRVVSPAVVYQSQRHFDCPLEKRFGGPIETKNGEITSHWDSLMMYGSVMSPFIEKAYLSKLDPITLSVFEDSGWYKVNFLQADIYHWGKGTGCNFGVGPCDEYPEFLCSGRTGCHYLHRNRAECKKISDSHHCRVFIPLDKGECFLSRDQITDKVFAEDGMCLLSNSTTGEETVIEGKCYKHRCQNQVLQVKMPTSGWITCKHGEKIQEENMEVQCPLDKDVVCPLRKAQERSTTLSPQQTDSGVVQVQSTTSSITSSGSCLSAFLNVQRTCTSKISGYWSLWTVLYLITYLNWQYK